ncbi:MAG: hypothetical protein ABI678_18760 [Kofleriaceae bacterium]
MLGILDTLVIAAGIAAWKHGAYPSVFPSVVALGLMPALVVGIALGYLAAESTGRSVMWRCCALAVAAVAGVAALGIAFGLELVIPLAAIPTVVGTLVLERATRHLVELAPARIRW